MATRLPRLQSASTIVDKDGRPTQSFQVWFQRFAEGIEGQLSALSVALEAKALAQQAVDIQAVTNSYTIPQNTISADSAGNITIATHVRVYADDTVASPHRVIVNGATRTAISLTDANYIYYDDPQLAGGVVDYKLTLDNGIAQTGTRHVVGGIRVPPSGDPPSEGTGPPRPGGGPIP